MPTTSHDIIWTKLWTTFGSTSIKKLWQYYSVVIIRGVVWRVLSSNKIRKRIKKGNKLKEKLQWIIFAKNNRHEMTMLQPQHDSWFDFKLTRSNVNQLLSSPRQFTHEARFNIACLPLELCDGGEWWWVRQETERQKKVIKNYEQIVSTSDDRKKIINDSPWDGRWIK